jgi:hypothetical protein
LIYLSTTGGSTWTQTSAPTNDWLSIVGSADGTKLFAIGSNLQAGVPGVGSLIYQSLDSGTTWTRTSAPTNRWTCLGLSADGTQLFAGAASAYGGQIYLSRDSGNTWTRTGAPSAAWQAMVSSADGSRAVAVSIDGWVIRLPYTGPWELGESFVTDNGDSVAAACSANGSSVLAATQSQLYLSRDSGTTWTPTRAPSNTWTSLAASADGIKLLAAAQNGSVFLSSDVGSNWMQTATYGRPVACSADGTTLLVADLGVVHTSDTAGANWKTTWLLPSSGQGFPLGAIACSADGSKVITAANYGLIYTTTNLGDNWRATSAPTNYWASVASSEDGSKLVAAANGSLGGDGLIYSSSDWGGTWKATSAPAAGWRSVASSADGSRLVTVNAGEVPVYTSMDFGATWTGADVPAGTWQAATITADGSQIVVVGGGASCSLRLAAPLVLSIKLTNLGPLLSWLLPSTSFTLQQSPDLNSGNWLDVTNQPRFIFSTLHQGVHLPVSAESAFYRLKARN